MERRVGRLRLAWLAVAILAVTVPPALLIWNAVRPMPWDGRTLRVRFESVRYETAALVFTYSVENRAWRKLRLTPDHTEIRLLQDAGQPPAGFPNFSMPLDFEGHSLQRVELRMELPATPPGSRQQLSDENTRRVLGQAAPGLSAEQGFGSPLPMSAPVGSAAEPPQVPDLNRQIEDALRDVNGFELIDPAKGVRLLFPRGW